MTPTMTYYQGDTKYTLFPPYPRNIGTPCHHPSCDDPKFTSKNTLVGFLWSFILKDSVLIVHFIFPLMKDYEDNEDELRGLSKRFLYSRYFQPRSRTLV